ncbi:MAG: hypothetical protein HUK05_05975 [Prevotella sp.]|nr:hypothetical protein [Prevotella sp.]
MIILNRHINFIAELLNEVATTITRKSMLLHDWHKALFTLPHFTNSYLSEKLSDAYATKFKNAPSALVLLRI